MKYKLYPPFLVVPEEEDFADVWEAFCFKLIHLDNISNNMHRRNPPEQGVDIFDQTFKIAYQCKSVESGKSGDFNVTKAIESLESALKIKDQLGWETYIICTNVTVSGTAEQKLKKIYPDLIIKSKNNWEVLCEKYADKVERNFNILVEVPGERVVNSIKKEFLEHYSSKLIKKLESESIEIYLFSNRYDRLFKITVSPSFTIKELIEVLRVFFKLPESKVISSEDISVSLSHSIVFNKKQQELQKTLGDIGIKNNDLITYWTTIKWKDNFEFKTDVIHHMTIEMSQKMFNKNERSKKAIEIFNQEIFNVFSQISRQFD